MKNRTILLGVAVLTIGFLVMPSTVSMFSGQHTWQDTPAIDCVTCHSDIQTELEAVGNFHHDSGNLGVATTNDACKYCHQTDYYSGSEGGSAANWTNSGAHAAITIECLDCHGDSPGNDPSAPNGTTGIGDELNATVEAHKPMYTEANADAMMMGANEACVACHTSITLDVTFVYNQQMNITADETSGTWNVTFALYNP